LLRRRALFEAGFLRALAHEEEADRIVRKALRGLEHQVEPVRHSMRAGVGHERPSRELETSSRLIARPWTEEIEIDPVGDDGHLLDRHAMRGDLADEGVRHGHDVVGAPVEEPLDLLEHADGRAVGLHRAHLDDAAGPEIAHFENERNPFQAREPESSNRGEELRRGADHDVGALRQERAEHAGRKPERRVIEDALEERLVRGSVDGNPDHADAVHRLAAHDLPAIALEDDAHGVVREPGEHGHVVAHADPLARELVYARGRRAHLGREILRDVEDLHATPGMSTEPRGPRMWQAAPSRDTERPGGRSAYATLPSASATSENVMRSRRRPKPSPTQDCAPSSRVPRSTSTRSSPAGERSTPSVPRAHPGASGRCDRTGSHALRTKSKTTSASPGQKTRRRRCSQPAGARTTPSSFRTRSAVERRGLPCTLARATTRKAAHNSSGPSPPTLTVACAGADRSKSRIAPIS